MSQRGTNLEAGERWDSTICSLAASAPADAATDWIPTPDTSLAIWIPEDLLFCTLSIAAAYGLHLAQLIPPGFSARLNHKQADGLLEDFAFLETVSKDDDVLLCLDVLRSVCIRVRNDQSRSIVLVQCA